VSLTEDPVEHRLAAIFAADVAGYSRLMGEDEAVTLSRPRRSAASLQSLRNGLVTFNIAGPLRPHNQSPKMLAISKVREFGSGTEAASLIVLIGAASLIMLNALNIEVKGCGHVLFGWQPNAFWMR